MMTATEQTLRAEVGLRHIKRKRVKVRKIILTALKRAISEGLKVENSEVVWVGSREEYATDLLNVWLEDEDGDLALDRLVNLIIY